MSAPDQAPGLRWQRRLLVAERAARTDSEAIRAWQAGEHDEAERLERAAQRLREASDGT